MHFKKREGRVRAMRSGILYDLKKDTACCNHSGEEVIEESSIPTTIRIVVMFLFNTISLKRLLWDLLRSDVGEAFYAWI